MRNKTFLVSVQEKHSNKVFGYMEVEAEDAWYAKRMALKQVEKEQKYTKKWACLHLVNWCLDAVCVDDMEG